MRLDVYVNYRGNCEEAFRFYERHLGGRRSDVDAPQEGWPRRSEHAQARHLYILTKRIGDEIHLMAQRRESPDAVKFAERRPARLEKRLGRDHQDAHAMSDFRTDP